MKKILLALLLVTLPLSAFFESIQSYQASFIQTIIDTEKSTITYTGTFSAKRPHYALWSYTTPTTKSVYIMDKDVTIIEPELEQAIKKESKKSFTLFNILEDAIKIDQNTYTKKIDSIEYTLIVEETLLKKVSYQDEFENNVTIIFQDSTPNIALKSTFFHPIIPESFDIITE